MITTRSFVRRSAAALGLATLAMTTTALADGAAPSASDRETARDLMTKGVDQRTRGDLPAALKSFEAADAIMHVSTTALEVARTDEAMGRLVEAREKALDALREPVKPGENEKLKQGRRDLQALADSVAPRIPSLLVKVDGVAAGTAYDVHLDGQLLAPETRDTARKIDPGHHVVDVAAGTSHGHAEVDLAEGETKELPVKVEAPAPVAQNVIPVAPPKSKSDPLLYGAFAGFGLGAVGLVVGGVTGYLSLHKSSDLKKQCPNDLCPANVYDGSSFQSERSSVKTLGTVSTISFIAGGVFVAAGATLFLLRPKHQESATATGLLVAPGFVSGTF